MTSESKKHECEACDGAGWVSHVDGRVDCAVCGGARSVDETKAIMRVIEGRDEVCVRSGRIAVITELSRTLARAQIACGALVIGLVLVSTALAYRVPAAVTWVMIALSAQLWLALAAGFALDRRARKELEARRGAWNALDQSLDALRAQRGEGAR